MTSTSLTSIAAVVAATIVIVQTLKRTLAEVKWFNRVPIWAYACLVAVGLTVLANKVLGSLSGNLPDLIIQAIANAATASGFYEWAKEPAKPLSDAGRSGNEDSGVEPE